ncbi:hypothetical protein LguiB_009434 [Lonicera macranthoides]
MRFENAKKVFDRGDDNGERDVVHGIHMGIHLRIEFLLPTHPTNKQLVGQKGPIGGNFDLEKQANLVRYAEKHKTELLEAGSSSSSTAPSQPDPSSWAPKRGPSNWSSKPKSKPKREKTEEEKKFRRRAKYFLVTEMVAVLVFLSLVARSDDSEVDLDDEEGLNYND